MWDSAPTASPPYRNSLPFSPTTRKISPHSPKGYDLTAEDKSIFRFVSSQKGRLILSTRCSVPSATRWTPAPNRLSDCLIHAKVQRAEGRYIHFSGGVSGELFV